MCNLDTAKAFEYKLFYIINNFHKFGIRRSETTTY